MIQPKVLPASALRLALILGVLAGSLGLIGKGETIAAARLTSASDTIRVFLPVVHIRITHPTIFGVAMDPFTKSDGFYQVTATNTTWTRRDLSWRSVESYEGERNWGAIQSLESDLILAQQYYLNVVVIVGDTPTWALKPGFNCGAVAQTKLAAFGKFMMDLVTRYSVPPYHIKYWELWNEPDVKDWMGCWGQPGDGYYGGGYYGQMLKVAYPIIKVADPSAQVMVGGLLLDCNPNNPPEYPPGSGKLKDCTPARFLEGILANGGGPYFDGVSFHAYDYYLTGPGGGMYHNPDWHSAWNTNGPALINKVDYIRSLLSRFNVSNKFILNTESALLCDSCTSDSVYYDDFQRTKADYVVESYAAAIYKGLTANIWYNSMGWRNSGFFRSGPSPLPAFQAYKTAVLFLGGSSSLGKVNSMDVGGVSGVTGYKYTSISQKEVWVLWSVDGLTHWVTLPRSPAFLWDVYRNLIPASDPIQIERDPIYVQFDVR